MRLFFFAGAIMFSCVADPKGKHEKGEKSELIWFSYHLVSLKNVIEVNV